MPLLLLHLFMLAKTDRCHDDIMIILPRFMYHSYKDLKRIIRSMKAALLLCPFYVNTVS